MYITSARVEICIYTHLCISMYRSVCICGCVCVYLHTYIYIYTHVNLSLSLYIYICVHMCVYIYIHMYMWVCVQACFLPAESHSLCTRHPSGGSTQSFEKFKIEEAAGCLSDSVKASPHPAGPTRQHKPKGDTLWL